MFSSFYTHIVLVVSCVIFSCSFVSFVNRIRTASYFYSSERNSADLEFQLETPVSNNEDGKLSGDSHENRLLREKVLGSSDISPSILHRFIFLNPPNPVCDDSDDANHMMLIVVLSRALNFDYRQAIRSTWGRNGKYKHSRIHIQTVFFVGTDDSVQLGVRDEQTIFNDVIEIGIPENYPFVAHKELASLLWTRLYCPNARLIFRADDDILLDTYLLLNYIGNWMDLDINDGLYGWFRFNNSVRRADKWAVTKLEYSSRIYPPYTFGIGYLFSNNSCQRLINAANHPDHQIIRIGDAYITGILRELAGISYYDFHNLDFAYTFFDEIPCDEYFEKRPRLVICMSKLHIGIRNDLNEFYDIWEIIEKKHQQLKLLKRV